MHELRALRVLWVLPLLAGCPSSSKSDDSPTCESDIDSFECPEGDGGFYQCDTCGQNWACSAMEPWWRRDVPCNCITEEGRRDTADVECRSEPG